MGIFAECPDEGELRSVDVPEPCGRSMKVNDNVSDLKVKTLEGHKKYCPFLKCTWHNEELKGHKRYCPFLKRACVDRCGHASEKLG